MTDLNTLISAGSPLYLLEAFGINDRGQISGFGQLSNGELRGTCWTRAGKTISATGVIGAITSYSKRAGFCATYPAGRRLRQSCAI